MTRLTRRDILPYLKRADLTALQRQRLQALADLVDADGRIEMAEALEVATDPGALNKRQDAFRAFRAEVRRRLERQGLPLRLEVDGIKGPPHERTCWFTGPDPAAEAVSGMSAREAGRGRAEALVKAAAAEVLPGPRPLVVHVSATRKEQSSEDARLAQKLTDLLRQQLALQSDLVVEVTDTLSVPTGVDVQAERDRLLRRADISIPLVSVDYLTHNEREALMIASRPHLPVALRDIPHHVFCHGLDMSLAAYGDGGKTFDRVQERDRTTFAAGLLTRLKLMISRAVEDPSRWDTAALSGWMTEYARRRMPSVSYVPGPARETKLNDAVVGLSKRRHLGDAFPAIERLLQWVTHDDQPLCALLGDVGMGKTTVTKWLTLELLKERETNPETPLPLYFDLRDLNRAFLQTGPNLREVIAELLRVTEGRIPNPSVDDVFDIMDKSPFLIIFDGLDEALVHLSDHSQQVFTRTLWRAIDFDLGRGGMGKLLLSCRTHHFRSIRDEATHLTGQDRESPRARDYLTLMMMPFTEELIRDYLTQNLPGEEIDRLMDVLASVHNLRELAGRPLTLQMITEQLEFIEKAKADHREVRAVELYAAIVERWMARDDGKHTLAPEHKVLLMEHLAAEIWRSGRSSWSASDVEKWAIRFIDQNPDIGRMYASRTPDIWSNDLRTATFLIRKDDDTFAFAHTSLREYFLASHLVRAITPTAGGGDDEVASAWAIPLPSPETLDFVGQLLARLAEDQQARARATLAAALGGRYVRHASEMAFRYAIHASRRGYPRQSLASSQLESANLAGIRIDCPGDPLDLSGCVLRNADLTGARLNNVVLRGADLSGANLTRTEILDSNLENTLMLRADLTGATFRHCSLQQAELAEANLYQTHAIWCQIDDAPTREWIVAPNDSLRAHGPDAQVVFAGIPGYLVTVKWSPDGSRILIGGIGRTQVWDAISGRQLLALDEARWVRTVDWSPDGSRILTGGGPGGVRVWDTTSGHQLLSLETPGVDDEIHVVESVVWSPDGSRILTGGPGGAQVWDAISGRQLLALDEARWVRTVGWSPDGSRILTGGGPGGVRVWDTTSGHQLLSLETPGVDDEIHVVESVVWSPDSSRILTGGHSGVQVWDAISGDLLLTLDVPPRVQTVDWSPDSSRILTGVLGRGSRVWDASTGHQLLTLNETGWVQTVDWSADGSRILTSEIGRVQVWDAISGRRLLTLTDTAGQQAAAWSPDGTRILTGSSDEVQVWDAISGHQLLTLNETGWVETVDWSPDGTQILTSGFDGTRIWDAISGHQLLTLNETGWMHMVGWSPDGARILTRGAAGVHVWNAISGHQLLSLETFGTDDKSDGAVHVAWSPDSSRILAGGAGAVQVWDAISGHQLLVFESHRVQAVGWSPDGSRILTGGGDGVQVWDAISGHQLLTFDEARWVHTVDWSRDGSRILTGGGDGVQVWDAISGHKLLTLNKAPGVQTAAWNPDGTRILTTGPDGVRVWDPESGRHVGPHIMTFAGESTVWSGGTGELVGASEGAWRHLGLQLSIEGVSTQLPVETLGPLPNIEGIQQRAWT